MRQLRLSVAMCVAAVALSANAQAADLDFPQLPPLPSIGSESNADGFAHGWYLRGDVGYRFNRVGSVSASAAADPAQNQVDRSWAIGLGLGYKKGWFRTDVTLDFGTPARYTGGSAAVPTTYTVRVASLTGLFNAYADLGTWSGITPYLGAGAGGSLLRTLDFATTTAVPPISSGVGTSWQFSWALMAGISYGVGRMAFDLGYRRLNLGTARTTIDAAGNQLDLRNLVADEIRLGMRLAL